MAPHLAPAELNLITQCVAKRMEAPQIWDSIAKLRKKAKVELPKIWVIRRAMAGITHKRGKAESRGRKKKLRGVQAIACLMGSLRPGRGDRCLCSACFIVAGQ